MSDEKTTIPRGHIHWLSPDIPKNAQFCWDCDGEDTPAEFEDVWGAHGDDIDLDDLAGLADDAPAFEAHVYEIEPVTCSIGATGEDGTPDEIWIDDWLEALIESLVEQMELCDRSTGDAMDLVGCALAEHLKPAMRAALRQIHEETTGWWAPTNLTAYATAAEVRRWIEEGE